MPYRHSVHQYLSTPPPDANELEKTKDRGPLPWPRIVCQWLAKIINWNISLREVMPVNGNVFPRLYPSSPFDMPEEIAGKYARGRGSALKGHKLNLQLFPARVYKSTFIIQHIASTWAGVT